MTARSFSERHASPKQRRVSMQQLFSRTVTAGLTIALAVGTPFPMPGIPSVGIAYAASVSVDGHAGDWASSELNAGSGAVSTWGATTDGANLYLLLEGNSGNGYYTDLSGVSLSSANLNGSFNIQLVPYNNAVNVFELNWNAISGATSAVTGDSSGNYVFEASIPLSTLGGSSATLSFNGTEKTVQFGGSSESGQSQGSEAGGTGSETGGSGSGSTESGGSSSESGAGTGSNTDTGSETGGSTSTATSNPTVDGNLDDWDTTTSNPASSGNGNQNGLTNWKIAKGADGNYYFAAWGQANGYVGHDWDQFQIDGQWNAFGNLQHSGGSYASVNNGNGNTVGPQYVECMIPASMMNADTFTFGGSSVSVADIPAYVAPTPEDDPGKYTGITIDGTFKDWKYVTKTDVKNPNH